MVTYIFSHFPGKFSALWKTGNIISSSFISSSVTASDLAEFIVLSFVNPLPDDKILDWSKLKQIEDGILSAFKMENKYHIG